MKTIAEILKELPVIIHPVGAHPKDDEKTNVAGITGVQRSVSIGRRYTDPLLVSPCDACGRDTYYDIFVAWAVLYDGEIAIVGYRLCDDCCRRALKEAKERRDVQGKLKVLKQGEVGIIAVCQILRVNDGVVTTPEDWREITKNPPEPAIVPEEELES